MTYDDYKLDNPYDEREARDERIHRRGLDNRQVCQCCGEKQWEERMAFDDGWVCEDCHVEPDVNYINNH